MFYADVVLLIKLILSYAENIQATQRCYRFERNHFYFNKGKVSRTKYCLMFLPAISYLSPLTFYKKIKVNIS